MVAVRRNQLSERAGSGRTINQFSTRRNLLSRFLLRASRLSSKNARMHIKTIRIKKRSYPEQKIAATIMILGTSPYVMRGE